MIERFQGKHRFLSNFWPAKVKLDNLEFPTAEHAYQAAKTLDLKHRLYIQALIKPGETKRAGRKLIIRSDWEQIKLPTMLNLLQQKFAVDTELSKLLLATGEEELVEGNTWGDVFWGQCPIGTGENHLGKLLMKIREDLTIQK